MTLPITKKHGRIAYEKFNDLVHEAHARKVVVKDKHGKEYLSFPLTLGISVAIITPIITGMLVVAYFLTDSTSHVEKHHK